MQFRQSIKQQLQGRIRSPSKSAFECAGPPRISDPGRTLEPAPSVRRPGDSSFIYQLGDELGTIEVVGYRDEGQKQAYSTVLINHQRLLAVTNTRGNFFR